MITMETFPGFLERSAPSTMILSTGIFVGCRGKRISAQDGSRRYQFAGVGFSWVRSLLCGVQ